MKIINDGYGTITVVLSRRNLLTLLTKLDVEWSEKTIHSMNAFNHEGEPIHDLSVYVKAEGDYEHYGDRTPGPVHPETERALKNYAKTN